MANFRNREYQRRAARQALAHIGATVIRDPNSGFYRPAVRPIPGEPRKRDPRGRGNLGVSAQMSFNFSGLRPLEDLIPEAYEKD